MQALEENRLKAVVELEESKNAIEKEKNDLQRARADLDRITARVRVMFTAYSALVTMCLAKVLEMST